MNPGDRTFPRTEPGNQGSMGSRQVSGPPAQTAGTSVREKRETADIAGATGPQHGLGSRRAVTAATPGRWRPPAPRDENASLVRPFSGTRTRLQTRVEPELPGGAGPPPPGTEPASDFLSTFRKLRGLRSHCTRHSNAAAAADFNRAICSSRTRVVYQFTSRAGDPIQLPKSAWDDTEAERSVYGLREMARRAETAGDTITASRIRADLHHLGVSALAELRALCAVHDITQAPDAQSAQSTPETSEPAATAAAVPSPTDTSPETGWFPAYRSLNALADRLSKTGWNAAFFDFHSAHESITRSITYRFNKLGGKKENLVSQHGHPKPVQAWYAMGEMLIRAERSGDTRRIDRIRRAMADLQYLASTRLDDLAGKCGPVEHLASMSTEALRALQTAEQRARAPAVMARQPPASNPGAAAMPTVRPQAPPRLHYDHAVERAPVAGGLPAGFDAAGLFAEPPPAALPTRREFLSLPPGPSSRVMAEQTMPAPASQIPGTPGMAWAAWRAEDARYAERMPIVQRFMDSDAVLNARHSLQMGGAGVLGWTTAQCSQVLEDIARLHQAARRDPAAATTLDELDWNSIMDLALFLYTSPPLP